MSHFENDKLFEALEVFMGERNLKVSDIMQDEKGAYYLSEDNDTGDRHKLYLPLSLQEIAQAI